jgi:nicotinate-nucleotide adenylyltransferase
MSGASVATGDKRVALYGGSFDPPHMAHVLIATWVLCRGEVDEVWLLPVKGHAFGKALRPFEVRCRMVAAAVEHLGPQVRVEPIEDTLPVPSYTIDTVRALLAREPLELTLVLGSDEHAKRHQWKAWDELEALVGGRVLVVGRGAEAAGLPEVAFAIPDVSSTEVRRRVAAGEPYGWMVPEAVREMIEREGLYRA